jgi:signal transduction histidine kinase/CheY-like chemotaxis protein
MERSRTPTDNDQLASRTARQPDYALENSALVRLARAQAGPKADLLQEIADVALSVCNAGSAGISLMEGVGESRSFRWLAVSGLCADLQGKTTAWDECPCGMTLQAGTPLLFIRPQDHFQCLRFPGVHVAEGVVVPIPADGAQLGAIWVMSHVDERQFDQEDIRLLSNLAAFAGSALTIINARDDSAESDRRHNQFIAMLGHELRNPMTPIDGAIGAAKRLCADNDRAVDVLDIAQRQMRHLRTLVDDLLDAARLKHGKLAIRHSDTSLNDITFDAVTAITHHIQARRHTLRITGLEQPLYVRADHVRLSQVLGNLLANAAKYTPAGGTIELNVRVEPVDMADDSSDVVVISVRDNGMGIDSEVQSHVFELFAQSVRDNARSEGGLGIGLAVAKRMIELHGGTISLHSEGQGQGTVVTLRLPILRTAADSDVVRSPPRITTAGPAHLLLVDDNRDALHALGVLLGLDGHEVTTADSGREAIRLMSEKRPDVAIIDLGMPEMDGFEVARTVREQPALDNILLVALTGYASESDKSLALAAGFDYHLTKPLSMDKLQYILANRADGRLRGIV